MLGGATRHGAHSSNQGPTRTDGLCYMIYTRVPDGVVPSCVTKADAENQECSASTNKASRNLAWLSGRGLHMFVLYMWELGVISCCVPIIHEAASAAGFEVGAVGSGHGRFR